MPKPRLKLSESWVIQKIEQIQNSADELASKADKSATLISELDSIDEEYKYITKAELYWKASKDGQRETFDRDKLMGGVLRACEKRPVSNERIEQMINQIEEKLRKKGSEVTSVHIGELVSSGLKKLDKIAYIRFASVYRDFTDLSDFKKEIKELVSK